MSNQKTVEITGEVAGGIAGGALAMINGDMIASTMIVVFISSILGGVTGFMVTRFMNWIFKKFDSAKATFNSRSNKRR